MRKGFTVMLASLLMVLLLFPTAKAHAAGSISWGNAQTASYNELQSTILMYKNELYDGGYELASQTTTTDSKQADFVMNTYGDLGAGGIVELNENLEAATDESALGQFKTTVHMKLNGVYLVVLHDGSYAKLRIDRITPVKVAFSYVLESSQKGAGPDASQVSDTIVLDEGDVNLTWNAGKGAVGWDLFRSDNGTDYVQVNDFRLTQPYFSDKYALAGHVYLYKYYAYNADGGKLGESPAFQVTVVKKGSTSNGTGTKIVMQLDNKHATVNGNDYLLEVAPTLINSSTMVPVRFVSEALGAKVQWDGSTKEINISLGSDTVVLQIDSVVAKVNGSTTYMTVPATIVNGSTLVPVRFVSENLKRKVEFNNDTKEIIITGEGGSTPPAPAPATPVQSDLSGFFHIWQLEIPSVAYEPQPGSVTTSVGAMSGGLLINEDGTYYWNSTWDGKLIEGKWKATGDADYPIVLLDGQENRDWKVGAAKDGTYIYVWNGDSIYYNGYFVK